MARLITPDQVVATSGFNPNAPAEFVATLRELGAVLKEVGKGYTLHERLLRPARVIVSKPAPSAEAACQRAA